MKTTTHRLATAALALSAWLCSTLAFAAPLKIGVTPGALADSVEVAAAEARQKGLDVKVIEFTDWTTPNTALAAGDLDINYFQHQAFLDNAIKESGYKFSSVAVGVLNNLALFSKKVKRFEDLKEGARIAVASDPVNQGRGLLLLEKAGLIKLRPGTGWRGTLNDVVGNPKKFKFVEVEGPQLVRAIDDVYFAIRFLTRNDNANDPRVTQFVKLHQDSPAVRARILKSYGGDSKLFVLPWVGKP